MTRILVVRLGALGDLVHTAPAVAAIRRAHPAAEIDWLVDAPHRPLLDLLDGITSVIPLRAPTVSGWVGAIRALRARRYDVAADFQGLLKSAALARLSGARRVVGFDRAGLREPAAGIFYTERVATNPAEHVIAKNMRLARAVGAMSDALVFPIRPVESAAWTAFRARDAGPFALINGGAGWPNKRWPADRLGRMAAWMLERHGLRSVVLWGPGEAELAAAIVAASAGAAVAAPETRLPDLVAFAREARLMLSGDTGPTHVAAALGAPVVALFGPTDPARNGPWNPADLALSRYDRCECHYQRECRRGADHACIREITEADVRDAIDRRLGGQERSP